MNRFFIRLAYNGTKYHGWQYQHNAPSVQEIISKGLELMLSCQVNLVGCGRTDSGVHAREFYAHFDLPDKETIDSPDQLAFRLNRYLPEDIAVFWIKNVADNLHARFSAISRTYQYHIHTFKDPFLNLSSWFVHDIPEVEIMNKGAEFLMEYEDFTSFSKLHSAAKTNICHLTEAYWTQNGHKLIFTITADRFLRNMVRAIVGTLVDLGQGKMTLEGLHQVIEAKNRSDAGQSVPALGLYLERVIYPVEL